MSSSPTPSAPFLKSFSPRIIPLIKLAVGLAIIVWFVRNQKINFESLSPLFSSQFLLPCFVCVFLNMYFCSERWRWLLISQNLRFTVARALQYTLVGQFFNFTVPGGMGGDIIKAISINKDFPNTKLVNAYSVFFDRVIGIFSLSFLAVVGSALNVKLIAGSSPLTTLFFLNLALCLAIPTGSLLLVFQKERIAKLCTQLPYLKKMNSPLSFRFDLKKVLRCVALGIASQIVLVAFFYMVGKIMLPELVDWRCCLFVVPLGLIASAVPIAPAGVGIGQASFYFLFNTYLGYNSELGPTAATFMQILLFFFSAIGTLWYYADRKWTRA